MPGAPAAAPWPGRGDRAGRGGFGQVLAAVLLRRRDA